MSATGRPARVRTHSLNFAAREPQARALAACLDVLVRMDPDAVVAGQLTPCSDRDFDVAVITAACVVWGNDRKAWPSEVDALLKRGQQEGGSRERH